MALLVGWTGRRDNMKVRTKSVESDRLGSKEVVMAGRKWKVWLLCYVGRQL